VVNSSLRDMPALATYAGDRCMLFIDGELWGMYEITEKASDYYIQSNYGVPAENVSLIKNGELEEGHDDEPLNLQLLGEYCRDNDLTVPENYEYVASQIDFESLIDCYCAGLYLGTWDWPNYNYLMWRYTGDAIDGNVYSDGKWRFGAFDFDYSVGLTYEDFGDVESYQHDSFTKMDGVSDAIPTVIFAELLKNPEFKPMFADKFYSYAYSVFESDKMVKELDDEESRYMSDPCPHTEARPRPCGDSRKSGSSTSSDPCQRPSVSIGFVSSTLSPGLNTLRNSAKGTPQSCGSTLSSSSTFSASTSQP